MSDVPYEYDDVEPTDEARTWAMVCHLSALLGFLPFLHIVAPLVVWLMKRDEHPFIDDQGKEAVNFQISMTIYFVLLCFSLIGIPIAIALPLVNIVMIIIAVIKVSGGETYRYPLTLRLIK